MTDETNAPDIAPAPPRFVDNGRPRFKVVALDWPVEHEGRVFAEVHLVKLTAKEVADFIVAIKDKGDARLPIFRDAAGAPIPNAVMDALDDDDKLALDEGAEPFLPRRFRAALASSSAQPDGAAIEPTSNE
jgi:hypothetical protein